MIKIVIKTVGVSLTLLALSGCSSTPSEFQTACNTYALNNGEGIINVSMAEEICSCTDDEFSDVPEKSVTVLTKLMQQNIPKSRLGRILVNKISKDKATEILNIYAGCGYEVIQKSYKNKR